MSNTWHVGYPYAVQLGDHKWHRYTYWRECSHYSLHFVTAIPPLCFVMYVVNVIWGALRSYCVNRRWNAWRLVVGLVR
jgi:hypothetical protein